MDFEKIEELLEDYSHWLHWHGYIDADYYAEEPKAIDAYMAELKKRKEKKKK